MSKPTPPAIKPSREHILVHADGDRGAMLDRYRIKKVVSFAAYSTADHSTRTRGFHG